MQSLRYSEGAILAVSVVVGVALFVLSSCASHPHTITAEHVSSSKYEDYDCDKLASEFERVSKSITELYWSLEAEAATDDAQFWSGVVFLFPLFWLEGGDGIDAAEYSRLKGEFIALKDAAIKKQCDPQIIPPDPEDQIKER